MLFAFKWLRSDTRVVNLICCASKGNLQCEFAFSFNQWILSNLNGNLNNDEFSQIKTRVHVMQQREKKRRGRSSILRAALLYIGNLPEEVVCNVPLIHREKKNKYIYILQS